MILSVVAVALSTASPQMTDAQPTSVIDVFATCMAKLHYRELTVALDSGFDAAFDQALSKVPTAKCAPLDMKPAGDVLRGALFSAMYRRFGPEAGRSASNLVRTWLPTLSPSDPRYSWYVLSACLVSKQPDAARGLVRAKNDANLARARMIVAGVLPLCLPAAQRVRVNYRTLTGFVAETVYQIDFATGPGEKKRFWSQLL